MKKKIIYLFIILSLPILFSACSRVTSIEKEGAPELKKIRISGSGSGLNLLSSVIELFKEDNPDIKIEILPGTGTGEGIIGVDQGVLDICLGAREMNEEERGKYPDLTESTFVLDAMVLTIHNSQSIDNLSKENIVDIFSGRINNWKELGGNDAEIVILDREESESSKLLLRKYILGEDLEVDKDAVLIHSAASMDEALELSVNAMGQTSLGMIKYKKLPVKALSIDGISPNEETVRSGSYEMVRRYGIIYDQVKLTSEAEKLIDYLHSQEVKSALNSFGFFPEDDEL